MTVSRTMKPLFTWRSVIASEDGPEDPTTRYVLLVLSLHMNELGESCFPSVSRLVAETGLGERTVRRHLRKAEQSGWLVRRELNAGGKGWRRYEYSVAVPASCGHKVRSERAVKMTGPTDGAVIDDTMVRSLTTHRAVTVTSLYNNSTDNSPRRTSTKTSSAGSRRKTEADQLRLDTEPSGHSHRPGSPTTAPPESGRAEVAEVFAYWLERSGHRGAKLTDQRRKKIQARLKSGFSVAELKEAIDGACSDPFMTGENDRGKAYDWPETIFRSDETTERHIDTARNGTRRKPKEPEWWELPQNRIVV